MNARIACLSLFLSVALSGHTTGSTDTIAVKDSLEHLLGSIQKGKQRLKTIFELAQQAKSNPEKRLVYAARLLDEAGRQKDNYYKCEAYYIYLVESYNRYDIEGVNKWANLLIPLARREKLYQLMFMGKRSLVDILLLQEQYELQEKEAKEMLREATELDNAQGIIYAYQCLANNYLYTFRYPLAFDTLQKAYHYAVKADEYSSLLEITTKLSALAQSLGNKADWLRYIQIQEKVGKDRLAKNPGDAAQIRSDLMTTYTNYLIYYSKNEQWDKAAWALREAEKYHSSQYSPLFQQEYYQARYQYYIARDEYQKATEQIDSLLYYVKPISLPNYYAFLPIKAFLLWNSGRNKEALALYKEIFTAKDSIQNLILDNQTEQIQASYTADNLLLEKEKIQKPARWALLILSCSAFAALVFAIVRFRRAGVILQREKSEMSRMAQNVEQANAAKERFLSNISASIRTPLGIIVDNSSTLSSDAELSPEQRMRLSETINATSAQLMSLINDILLLSKLEAGMQKLNTMRTDLVPYLSASAEAAAGRSGITVEISLPPDAPWQADVDPGYFSQIMDSLLAAPISGYDKIILRAETAGQEHLKIFICGTLLATPEPTQESTIRNEINRMLIENFAGRYDILSDQTPPCIVIGLPLV